MSPPSQSPLPPTPSSPPHIDGNLDADARDAHRTVEPTRLGGHGSRDAPPLSLPASISASAASSRSTTPSYMPAAATSSTATLGQMASPGGASLTPRGPSQAKSKSHAPAAGYTTYPHPSASANASQHWLLRPVARAPSAESLSVAATASAVSRKPFAAAAAPVHPETHPHPRTHFPPPPSPSPSMQKTTPQNHSPNQSPTIDARVPTNMAHPPQRGSHPPPPPLKKQHSAFTLGGAEAGRGHGYYNHGARGMPSMQGLPPLHAQIAANTNRKASTSVSTSSSASAYAPSTPTSPTGTTKSPTTTNTSYTGHIASPISMSPPNSLLSTPMSPVDRKLPPLPSSSRYPPHSHGPRRAVSHNNMRSVRTRARPSTSEGVVGNRGIGVGMGGVAVGIGQKERGGSAVRGEKEWEKEREWEREDVTPWEFQTPFEHAGANTGAVAQSQRSRASSAVGATGPMEEVTPWEAHASVGGEHGGKDVQERERAGHEEVDAEDMDYGVSRPMEFGMGRTRASNAASTISGGSGSNSTGNSAVSVRSRASSAALGATGPIEEVTPWEVQAPDSGTRARNGSSAGAQSVRSRASSTALSATGPVEEVTPWEVQTLIEENEGASDEFVATATTSSGSSSSKPTTKSANTTARTTPHRTKERSDSRSTTAPSTRAAPSIRSRASSAAIGTSGYALGVGAGGSVATGPVEEVTPWEVQVPTSGADGEIDGDRERPRTSIDAYGIPRTLDVDAAPFTPSTTTPGTQSVRSDVFATGTRAVEEVTPWEIQAGETVYGLTREVRVPASEKERERSRSILSFHSAGTGGHGSTPATATSTANGNAYNSHNKAPSVRSGRSRASSGVQSPGGVGTASTGSVEEVTPWEMYPAPPVLHSPPPPLPTHGPGHSTRKLENEGEKAGRAKEGSRWRKSARVGTTPNTTPAAATAVAPSIAATTSTDSTDANYARSVKSTHTHKSTGPVEDVTPWEVQDLPLSPPLPPVASRQFTNHAATMGSSFSHHAGAKVQAIADSDPHPVPHTGDFATARSSAPPRTSAATTSTTGSGSSRPRVPAALAEEVTPWEFAGALPVQVERITASGPAHVPLGVTVEVHFPGENEWGPDSAVHHTSGEGQELEVPNGWGEGSTPNTATFSTSSGHHSGGEYGPPSSATSHTSYSSTAASYVSNASTTTGAARPARKSMTLDQLAEVTPWELHPVPTKVGSEIHAEEKAARERRSKRTQESNEHARQSTSGASTGGTVAQALADFGLRRRRSTGASGAEAVVSTSNGGVEGRGTTRSTKKGAKSTRMSTSGVVGAVSSSDMMPLPDAAVYPGPHPASTAASSKRKGKARADTVDSANDRFSTADRTILEELKASIRAREAQFKLKGGGHTVLGGGRGPGKKYHPYPKDVVPYPRAYGRDVIDLDVWETLFYMDMSDSLTFHVFETPPTKVLEIGCGTGTWLLHCARTWKECHFVGLDIVPLHPDLQNVGSPDLASRITWVQHNFLEGLPFQNEEFDFVHIKRIALGVPENKWDSLFEEVARVMKPGARLEMIEEDLFFPGKKADDEDDDRTTLVQDDTSLMTRRDSTSSDKRRTSLSTNGTDDVDRETVRLEDVSEQSEPNSPPTPKSHNTPLLNEIGILRPGSPVHTGSVNGHPIGSHDVPDHHKFAGGSRHHQHSHLIFPAVREASGSSLSSMAHDGVVTPHSRSTSRPTLPKAKDPYADFMLSSSSVSLLGTMGYLPSHDPLAEAMKRHRKQEAAAKKNNAPIQGSQKTKPSPLLSTLTAKGPVNPRDHTILEAIWEGMLEGRFVNSAPLSLLQTYLEYHFTGTRTHPPLIYTFPPVPPKVEESDDEEPSHKLHVSGPLESDTDDARDVVPRPKPKPRSTLSSNSGSSNTGSEEKRYLSIASLVQRESPFVSFDTKRSYAYSPSKKALFRARAAEKRSTSDKDSIYTNTEPHIMPRMPNTTLHVDLNTLNMQLTLRAKEIVACSESMWEWVEEVQNSSAGDEVRSGMATPWYVDGVDATADSDVTRSIILDMTREDFDRLLCNFEWDMLDKACMGQALADRFDWHTFEGAILADRKAYNKACRDYDAWVEEEQKVMAAADAYQHTQHRNSLSTPGLVFPPPDVSTPSHDHSQTARSSSNPESSSASVQAPSITTLIDDMSSATTTLAVPSSSRTFPETASATSGSGSHSGSGLVEAASMASSVPSSQMLPQQMLSRALRAFVAWKAM